MALPGFRNHPKFRRLVAALGIPEAHALGHVEMLWEVAYENGNAVLGDATDVELAAGWTGAAGALCRALLECGGATRHGLIDELETGIFQVHDLMDHAPEYVGNRRKRVEEKSKDKICENCGKPFRTSDSRSRFCLDSCRKAFWRKSGKRDGRETDRDGSDSDCPSRETDRDGRETDRDGSSDHYQPSPVVHTPNGVCVSEPPRPLLESDEKPKKPKREKPKKPTDQSLEEILGGKGSEAWECFWETLNAWGREKIFSPKKIAIAWKKACESVDRKVILAAAIGYRDSFAADKRQYMRNPLDWLEGEAWIAQAEVRATGGRASPPSPASGPRGPAVAALRSQVATLHFPTIPKTRGAPE